MNKKIILASQSPRRQELLKEIGLDFQVLSPNISEKTNLKKPSAVAKDLAIQKALAIQKKIDFPAVIIAADTIVYCQGEIIGKPKSYKDAERILKKLTKYAQYVYTGFAIFDSYDGKKYVDYEKTKVVMHPISDELLPKIIAENMDKAGCYAIQSGDKLVKSIKGDYFNVVGLPVTKVVSVLRKCSIKIKNQNFKK